MILEVYCCYLLVYSMALLVQAFSSQFTCYTVVAADSDMMSFYVYMLLLLL
jgi:hypothetical protein